MWIIFWENIDRNKVSNGQFYQPAKLFPDPLLSPLRLIIESSLRASTWSFKAEVSSASLMKWPSLCLISSSTFSRWCSLKLEAWNGNHEAPEKNWCFIRIYLDSYIFSCVCNSSLAATFKWVRIRLKSSLNDLVSSFSSWKCYSVL